MTRFKAIFAALAALAIGFPASAEVDPIEAAYPFQSSFPTYRTIERKDKRTDRLGRGYCQVMDIDYSHNKGRDRDYWLASGVSDCRYKHPYSFTIVYPDGSERTQHTGNVIAEIIVNPLPMAE